MSLTDQRKGTCELPVIVKLDACFGTCDPESHHKTVLWKLPPDSCGHFEFSILPYLRGARLFPVPRRAGCVSSSRCSNCGRPSRRAMLSCSSAHLATWPAACTCRASYQATHCWCCCSTSCAAWCMSTSCSPYRRASRTARRGSCSMQRWLYFPAAHAQTRLKKPKTTRSVFLWQKDVRARLFDLMADNLSMKNTPCSSNARHNNPTTNHAISPTVHPFLGFKNVLERMVLGNKK